MNYYRKEDAAKAIATLNGFGYDHLILRCKSFYIYVTYIYIQYNANFEIFVQCGMGQACPGALGG